MTCGIPMGSHAIRAEIAMAVFRSIVLSSVIVGLMVGGVVTVLQHLSTLPLILKGEIYEEAMPANVSGSEAHVVTTQESGGHGHRAVVWAPKNGWERSGYTLLANILAATGFALLLGGIYTLRGHAVTGREGVVWGAAGFLVFVVAPGVGLPPTLPGVPTAPLESRQLWWIATAGASAAGLALWVFKREAWAAALGLGLIALPHVVGAPKLLTDFHTNVPQELSHQFVAGVVLTGFVFWALLGYLTAIVQRRLTEARLASDSYPHKGT